MKLDNAYDPAVMKFLVSSYESEAWTRLRWNVKYKSKIDKAARFKREVKNYTKTDPLKRACELGLSAVTRDHKESASHRYVKPITDTNQIEGIETLRKGHSIVDIGLGDPKVDKRLARPETDLSPDPVMRLVDAKVKKTLYKHPPPRRELYLKERYKLAPEERYYFPQTTYMEYGWRMHEYRVKQWQRRGCHAMMEKIYSNSTGPQPDPPHYKPSHAPRFTRCIEN